MRYKLNNVCLSLINSIFIILMFMVFPSLSAHAENVAGKVLKSKGDVHAQIEGQEKRKLRIGKKIFEKDQVSTGSKSTATLLFSDKTRFELGEDSTLVVNEYLFANDPEKDATSIKVLKGSFRFVSGLIAKENPESMEVSTTVATIGIRGTNVIGEATATSSTIILVEPEDKSRKTAIEVSNNFGSVVIDEPGYGTEIPDAYSPPSPPRRMSLQTINNLTRSIQSVQRMNIPRPR